MSKKDWQEGFKELTAKTHREQAKWWLNGFWNEGAESNAEAIWEITHTFLELDLGFPLRYGKKKQEFKEGSDLDELASHQILERLGETMTVLELRKRLAKLDIDKNNRMALSEYLLDKFSKTPAKLVGAPQGSLDSKELEAAEAKCALAGETLADAIAKKEACDVAEKPLKEANEALQKTVELIEAEEKKRADLIAKLDGKINNKRNSAVTIGRANAEKEALLSEDPLPLRKAKITQKSQLKKVKKKRKPFKLATKAAADAMELANAANEDAIAFLEELKSRGGTPHGSIWWMEREMTENRKFMPGM